MTTAVYSYTIYHSPNAYLGTVLLRRAIAGLSGVELVRRPIYVPRDRGPMIAELLGGKENRNAGSYNREDCRRWSERFAIPMSYPDPSVFHERAKRWAASLFEREELPARAFYAADPERRDRLDQALFEAAWVEGLDVSRARRPRPPAPDGGIGRSQSGRGSTHRHRRVRAPAMPRRPYPRRQRPALLRQGPGRLGRQYLSRRRVNALTKPRANCASLLTRRLTGLIEKISLLRSRDTFPPVGGVAQEPVGRPPKFSAACCRPRLVAADDQPRLSHPDIGECRNGCGYED